MPFTSDPLIHDIDDVPSRLGRTHTPPPPKANSINAGGEARSPGNKRKLLPAAATTQDPNTGRLGKRARVDSAPFDTPGESSAAQVSAPPATTKTSSSAGTLSAATKRFKTDTPPTNTNSSGADTPPAATKRFKAGTLQADTKSPRDDTPQAANKSSGTDTPPAANTRSMPGTPPAATKTKPRGKPSSSSTKRRAPQPADKSQVASNATATSTEAGTLPAANMRSGAGTSPIANKSSSVGTPPVAASSSNHKNQATKPLHIVSEPVAVDTKRKIVPSSEDGRAPKRIRAPSRVRAPNRVRDCACHECIDHSNHAPSNGSRSSKFPAALLPFKERSRHMKRDGWARRKWKAKPSPLSQDGGNSVNNLRGVQSARLTRNRNRNTSHITFNEDDPDSASPAGLADSGANTPSLGPNTLGTGAPVPMPPLHIGTPLASPLLGAISSQYPAGQDASNTAALQAAPGMFSVDMPSSAGLAASNYGV
ncbi:hypothetical protein GGI24_003362, partial [Coemansia furcata]